MSDLFGFVPEASGLSHRESYYILNLIISDMLLDEGLITQEEYSEIDSILKQKYHPALSVFISENP